VIGQGNVRCVLQGMTNAVARSALRIHDARRCASARGAGRWLSIIREESEDVNDDAGVTRTRTSRITSAPSRAAPDAAPRRLHPPPPDNNRLRPTPRRRGPLDPDEDQPPTQSSSEDPARRARTSGGGPYFRGAGHIKSSYLDALSKLSAPSSRSGQKLSWHRGEPRWVPPPPQIRMTHPPELSPQPPPAAARRTRPTGEEGRSLPAAAPLASKPAVSSFASTNSAPGATPWAPKKASSFTNPFQFSKRTVDEVPPQPTTVVGPNLPRQQRAWNESEPAALFAGDSIFDVFRIKDEEEGDDRSRHTTAETSRSQKPGAFDSEAFRQYTALLRRVVYPNKRLRKMHTSSPLADDEVGAVLAWLESDSPAVSAELPSLRDAIRDGLPPIQPTSAAAPSSERSGDRDTAMSERRVGDAFRGEAEGQRQRFREATGWTKPQHQLAQNALYLMANTCAKEIAGPPVHVVWEKVKEAGIVNEKLLHVLLYVSAMFSPSGFIPSLSSGDLAGSLHGTSSMLDVLSAGTAASADGKSPSTDGKSPSTDGEARVEQLDEIALFHDLLFEPTEQTINIRVRLLTAQGKVKEAEALLHAWAEKVDLRLRTCVPVLLLLLDRQQLGSALRLLKLMQNARSVHLDAATYVNVVATFARSGAFGPTASPIESATDLGYRAPCGPGLLNHIVEEMSNDVMDIPLASAKRLHNAFAEGFPESGLQVDRSLLPLMRAVGPAPQGALVVSKVHVDPATGECTRTGVRLRLIQLTAAERLKLKDTIVSMARSGQEKFEQESVSKSPKRKTRKSVDQELLRFFDWLDQREGEPFTVVVDAANVAYYLQNFDEGRFSFHQIQFVVDALEKLGERPLVILPNKYSLPYFYVTIGIGSARGPKKQVQTPEELEILSGLRESGKLYVVPAGCLDDYFWIIASVSEQTEARKGADLQVEPGDSLRWPGTRPVLVSNDQMRDHKLEMLEPMLFRRWYSNFIVIYSFSGFLGEARTSAEIGFSPAKFYSREIQGNPDNAQSMVWHFPLEDAPDEWLCLRLPTKADFRDSEVQTDGK
jgi:Zc3h12a-like Ribonuclease NYN domain